MAEERGSDFLHISEFWIATRLNKELTLTREIFFAMLNIFLLDLFPEEKTDSIIGRQEGVEKEFIFRLNTVAFMAEQTDILSIGFFDIDWLLDKVREDRFRDIVDTITEILGRHRLAPHNLNSSQVVDTIKRKRRDTLQYYLDKLVRRIPILHNYKQKHYTRYASASVSQHLVPRDDPGFSESNLGDIVGEFLFKGRKNRSRSGRKNNSKVKSRSKRNIKKSR